MKKISLVILFVLLTSCAAQRVLVNDCKDAGPDLQNCELVKNI